MEKTDTRKLEIELLQQLRQQAIRLRKKGMTYKAISEVIDVHYSTICGWWKVYEKEGAKGIRFKTRGRKNGDKRTLKPEQEKELQKIIGDNEPDQLKLPFALWTRRAVQQIIRKNYRVDMPIRTVGEYLKRWGFTPQKPLKRAYEQNPEAIKKWVDEEYPKIAWKAKKGGAEIHWGDETGLCSDSQHGRSYAPRGKTPAIRPCVKKIVSI
jgi:transposase